MDVLCAFVRLGGFSRDSCLARVCTRSHDDYHDSAPCPHIFELPDNEQSGLHQSADSNHLARTLSDRSVSVTRVVRINGV